MIRINLTVFIVLITGLIVGLIGCSAIEYNNDKSKDAAITNLTVSEKKIDLDSTKGVIQKPISHINDLAIFLNKYDCSAKIDSSICYEKTRARLIQITKDLDEAESKIYKLKRSTGVLRNN